MELNTQNTLKSSYETLLLGYAAGSLDEAQNLVVATHLTYSPDARNFVSNCEAIGGSLIESMCEPVNMCSSALDSVLDRIAEPNRSVTKSCVCPDIGFGVPKPLQSCIENDDVKWHTVFPGMTAYDLKLSCQESKARFMKAAPGLKSPHHGHGGTEITLVLDGAFEDETGKYKVGDLIVTDEDMHHTPLACENRGCTCLVVTSAPIKLTGIASLLNPFLKP